MKSALTAKEVVAANIDGDSSVNNNEDVNNSAAASSGPATEHNNVVDDDNTMADPDVLRATQNSLRDAVGAFAVNGPGASAAADDSERAGSGGGANGSTNDAVASGTTQPTSSGGYSSSNLPPNIDIIAEATLVPENNDDDEAAEQDDEDVDTLGLPWDAEANRGGVANDSTSVDVSALTTPIPAVVRHSVSTREPQGLSSTNPTRNSTDVPSDIENNNSDGREDVSPTEGPIAHAEPMDKISIYAFGTSFKVKSWHLVLFAFCVLAAIVVPLAVVLPNKNKSDENEPSKNVADEQAQDEEGGGEGTKFCVVAPEPVLMELPAGISANEECEYQLYDTNSTFLIDSILLNDKPITTDNDSNNEGGSIITARPGSKLRVKGKASTCSCWCPTCLAQLYVSLMDFDDGRLYDPCKYLWAGQVILTDQADFEDVLRPPRDATSKCFDNRMNNHCPETDFDVVFVLDADSYPADSNTKFGIVLSVSYEYLCQEELKENKLNILGVSEEYFVQVEGEEIEIVQEVSNNDEVDTETLPQECDWELHNNTSTFTIDELYLNNATVIAAEGMEPTVISASPGDTIRIKGKAATCAKEGEGTYAWCPECWVQLYVSLMSNDEDVSLYDPCEYLWAPQVLFDGIDKEGVDFRGADDEPDLIRHPNEDMTSPCFEAYRLNGNCTETKFDTEFVIGANDGATEYSIVLTSSFEYYCQESLLENRLRILSVSDDYSVQVEQQQEDEEVTR